MQTKELLKNYRWLVLFFGFLLTALIFEINETLAFLTFFTAGILFLVGLKYHHTSDEYFEKRKKQWYSKGDLAFWTVAGGGIGGIIYVLIKQGDKKKGAKK